MAMSHPLSSGSSLQLCTIFSVSWYNTLGRCLKLLLLNMQAKVLLIAIKDSIVVILCLVGIDLHHCKINPADSACPL